MKIVKRLIFMFTSVLLVACSADEKLVTNALVENEKPQTISAELNFSVIQDETTKANTRSLSFDVTEFAAPKLNLEGKERVTVHCVFYNTKERTFSSAPLSFRVVDGKSLVIAQGQKFNLTLKKDIRLKYEKYAAQLPAVANEEWYMMGIIADNATPNSKYRDQGHYKDFRLNDEGYAVQIDKPFAKVTAGQSEKVELDIPYAFLWRKLRADKNADGNYVFTAEKPAVLKPMGSIIRLNITNATNYKLKYNGFTFITSGSTSGSFVLDLARYFDLKYQAPATVEEAKAGEKEYDKAYKQLVKAMWVDKEDRTANVELNYTKYKFENNEDVHLANNQADPSTYWVWFIPKEASKGNKLKQDYPNLEIQKAQFLLHSKTDEENAPQMAMLPVYGSKANYVNGHTYPAKGKALYNWGPLNFVAPANCTATGGFSNYLEEAKQFSPKDMGTLEVPEGYHIPTRMEWQTIFARFAGTGYLERWTAITPGDFNGKTMRFAQYGSNRVSSSNLLSKFYQHIVTMAKYPKLMGELRDDAWLNRFRAEPRMGYCWYKDGATYGQNYTDKAYGSSFNPADYPQITNDDHKSVIRIDYVSMDGTPDTDAHMQLTQRYLGPNFILTPYDIQDDRYWMETGRDDLKPLEDEFQRSLPMYGFALKSSYNENDRQGTAQNFGYGAIYWSNTEANTENKLPAKSTNTRLPLYFNLDEYSRTDNLGDLCESPRYKLGQNAHNSEYPIVKDYSAFVRLFTNKPQTK